MSGWERLRPEVMWALAAVLAILIIASVVSIIMVRLSPNRNLSELRQRIRTWWVLAGLFGLSMILSHGLSLILLAFTSFVALKEFFSIIPTRRADRRVLFWAYLAVPLQYYWVWSAWYGMFIVFIPIYVAFIIQVRMILIGETDGFLRSVGAIHWGLMTTVFSLSHAAFLLMLDQPAQGLSSEFPAGPGLLLFLVVLTQLNDVAQFLWGKTLGGPKVVPKVSPGKTWSGFLGGVGTSIVLAAFLGPMLTPLDWQHGLIAGAIIGIGGFFGDLTVSCLKRDLGIKDSGSILPGHGGMLDRIDSLTYTAPLFYHFVYWSYF